MKEQALSIRCEQALSSLSTISALIRGPIELAFDMKVASSPMMTYRPQLELLCKSLASIEGLCVAIAAAMVKDSHTGFGATLPPDANQGGSPSQN